MKFRVPDIVLGAFLTVAVFAMGMLFSSQYQQIVGIDPKQGPAESVQSSSDAQHASPGEVKPVSQQQQSGGHSDTHEIYGVKPGEFLLFLATVGLWYATARLVRDAKQNAELQLRAYIGLISNDINFDRLEFIIVMRNDGQTPGLKVTPFFNMQWYPPGRDMPTDFAFSDYVQSRVGTGPVTITPGQIHPWSFDLNREAFVQFNAGLLWKFYVYGRFEYLDVFGKGRISEFCYEGLHLGGGTAVFRVADRHNETT